ncbi:DUF885 domain-containing protein [Pseudemcibacter aquimaris]|uniref:DUF885 domain-containing protein n=1 Tax=Pseudemcibacter aquimaris TaxID=2857064 RepID=UPI00201267FF|nr:DUF885 domain-containing protein [Pseudemcibacter aquimaris]MCC3859602.1 DUF885 domain-containing protein [Pseudemcibacter aquimaris]WDU59998.1 DUF885 domain-containing protein [Pseudemcibacter aquimaris]
MKFKSIIGIVLLCLISACVQEQTEPQKPNATELLHDLFDRERQWYYAEYPGTGPSTEPRPVPDRMRAVSPTDQKRRMDANLAFLAELDAISKSELSDDDQLNHDMFRFMLNSRLTMAKHRTWRMPILSDSGFHTRPAISNRSIAFFNTGDYQTYFLALNDIPRYIDENIENMRTGIAEGFTMPKVVLDGLMPSFKALSEKRGETSDFYYPYKNMIADIQDDEREDLQKRAIAIIDDIVVPAYARLYDFMLNEYYPAARDTLGASETSLGMPYYEDMVRYYTTIDISADEVHELGKREVARIRAEMEDILNEVEFDGTLQEFFEFMRTDEQFYAKTPEELIMIARDIAKRIDGKLPMLFKKLPRQPYTVVPVPATLAPNYTTGRYSGAPLTALRGGEYWVNTYALDQRPLYNLPSLTLHEAVPGHHLQSALSKELENVPEFRLGLYPHAYGEGWGLYSEKLGLDIDIYQTPYEQFGRLTYEMWRAGRLVIDTGIHAKGWTREQAIALFEENSALSSLNIRTEVDRYISWPGQALAYKMGELKFIELRERAKAELGNKFDLRTLHDQYMSQGGLPMYLLEERIDNWIKEQ